MGAFLAFTAYNARPWPGRSRSLGRVLSDTEQGLGSAPDRAGLTFSRPRRSRTSRKPQEATTDGDIVFDHVSFGYEGAAGAAGRILHHPCGQHLRHFGRHRLREDAPWSHLLDRLYEPRRRTGDHHHRRRGHPENETGLACAVRHWHGAPGALPLLSRPFRRTSPTAPSPHATLEELRRGTPHDCAVMDEAIMDFARGVRHRRWRTGRDPFRRAEAAGGHRPDAGAAGPHHGL